MYFQSLRSILAIAQQSLQTPHSPLQGKDHSIAPQIRLQSFARLPTQLACFINAVADTFLSGEIVEPILAIGSSGAAGAFSLCRRRGYFARWRAVGAREVFEPVDVIAESPEAVDALAAALARQSRPLILDRIPADSLLPPAIAAAMRGKGWISRRPATPRPVITLDSGWSDPASRFNAGRQSDFRRALRKAERHGAVAFEIRSPAPAEFDALFAEAVAVELCGWKQTAGTALGVDQRKLEFFRQFLRAACAQDLCRIAFMRIDGRAVAMQLAVEWGQRFWLFKIGYDETYRDCSPGNLLMLHTIGQAATRGLTSYELLGNTERWISQFWTQEQLDCLRVRTYPANVRGLVAFAADALTWLACRLQRRAR